MVQYLVSLGVPAQLAGCREVVLCTPSPASDEILFAARACGVEKVFAIGGAQAIAAMAYGSESIPKVDKIFGPGNAFVTEAKGQVSRDWRGAAIDMPAGPSEVLVIADESASGAEPMSRSRRTPMSRAAARSSCWNGWRTAGSGRWCRKLSRWSGPSRAWNRW